MMRNVEAESREGVAWEKEHQKELRICETALKEERDPTEALEWLRGEIKILEREPTEEAWDLFVQRLPHFVQCLLKRSDYEEHCVPRVNDFFKFILLCAAEAWHSSFEIEEIEGLWEAVAHILNDNQKFYRSYGRESFEIIREVPDSDFRRDDDDEEDDDDNILPHRFRKIVKQPVDPELSTFWIGNVEYFHEVDGFHELLSRIEEGHLEKEMSMTMYRAAIRPFTKVKDILIEDAIVDWSKRIRKGMLPTILNLKDERLKNEDTKTIGDIVHMVETLCLAAGSTEVPELIEKFRLDLALKCFISPILEKRLIGLNDIKDTIANILKKDEYMRKLQTDRNFQPSTPQQNVPFPVQYLDTTFMVQWLHKNRIMQRLFSENIHEEVLRRSGDIVKFLAHFQELENRDIDLIWDSIQGKHESVCHTIFQLVGEVAPALSYPQLEHLYEKIATLPKSAYDTQTVYMIRCIAIAAASSNILESCREPRPIALQLLWECLQDENSSVVSPDVVSAASHNLNEIFAWVYPALTRIRTSFLAMCVSNIQKGTSISQSIRLAMTIITCNYQSTLQTSARSQRGSGRSNKVADAQHPPQTQQAYLESLEEQFHFMDLLVKEVERYKSVVAVRAREILQQRSGSQSPLGGNQYFNLNNERLNGTTNHAQTLHDLFNFMKFLMTNSNHALTMQQVDRLWDACVTRAITSQERDAFFQWLQALCTPPSWEQHGENMSLVKFIFEQKIPSLDLRDLSDSGFRLFEFFFRLVNVHNGSIEWVDEKSAPFGIIVLKLDMAGPDILWRIVMEAVNPAVGKSAVNLLNILFQNLSTDLKPRAGATRQEFVVRCMRELADAAGPASANLTGANAALCEQKVDRCLTLLRVILDDFDVKMAGSARAGVARKHGANARGSRITVSVQVVSGGKFDVPLYANDTIGSLRQNVSDLSGITPPSMIRLIASGKELKEEFKTLAESKIGDKHTVHATRRMNKDEAPAVNGLPLKGSRGSGSGMDIDQQGGDKSNLEEECFFPTTILSKQQYFDQLFDLLSVEQGIGQKVWDLLMLLPTNERMLSDLEALPQPESATEGSNGPRPCSCSWSTLLDSRSIFRLLYSLQIVESLIQSNPSQGPSGMPWCTRFIQRGGVDRLVEVLLTVDFSRTQHGSKRTTCLALLLKILSNFVLDPSRADSLPKAVNSTTYAQTLLEIIRAISNGSHPNPITPSSEHSPRLDQPMPIPMTPTSPSTFPTTPTDSGAELDVVRLAMRLLCEATMSSPEVLNFMFLDPSRLFPWIFNVLVEAPPPAIRDEVYAGLFRMCNFSFPDRSAPRPGDCLLQMLASRSVLDKVEHFPRTCDQYFRLLENLVCDALLRKNPSSASLLHFEQLLMDLVWRVKRRPICEPRNAVEEDKVLVGEHSVIRTIVCHHTPFKALVGPSASPTALILHLFNQCLFDIASKDNHGMLSPPKCKTRISRQAAFCLLCELGKDCPPGFRDLVQLVSAQHSGGDRRNQWSYQPSALDKAVCGYVGLRNLGATCYMNSLLQQFYMIPEFRWAIMSVHDKVPLTADERRESLLCQLQTLFGYLQESEKKFFDTRDFCAAYKDYDGQPMNTSLQMDVDEFFNMLFDRLESLLKKTHQKDLLRNVFGGTVTNQIICRGCPHYSERDEAFYVISLEVKNKKTIEESLDLYVQGEMLEGDNRYQCAQCSEKRDAVKRACIKTLPNTLILHLKRFEFDLDSMKKIKVTENCEFPMMLNMEAYTKEGITRREVGVEMAAAKSKGDEEGVRNAQSRMPPLREQWYYEYRLVGILVHTGTADSGHYYSFIQERESPGVPLENCRWYQFNDTLVETFDEKDIGRCCYGGVEPVQQWDPHSQKQFTRYLPKPNSAYMLFYERMIPPSPSPSAGLIAPPLVISPPAAGADDRPLSLVRRQVSTQQAALFVPKLVYKEIWAENQSFLHDKNIFDVDYFNWLWDFAHVHANPPALVEYDAGVDETDPVLQTIQFSVRFVIETLSHAKEKASFPLWVEYIQTLFTSHLPACKWFLNSMAQDAAWLRSMLLSCNIAETRGSFASLVLHVIKCLAPLEHSEYLKEEHYSPESDSSSSSSGSGSEKTSSGADDDTPWGMMLPRAHDARPQTIIARFMDAFFSLLKEAPHHWKHFTQYFTLMKEFASIGYQEREYLLTRHTVARLVDFCLGDESPLAKTNLSNRQKKIKMGDKFSSPNLSHVIATVSLLVRSCYPVAPTISPNPLLVHSPFLAQPHPFKLPDTDYEMIFKSSFFNKIIRENANIEATAEILNHYSWENTSYSNDILNVLIAGIESSDYDTIKHYLDTLHALVVMQDTIHMQRVKAALERVMAVMVNNKFRSGGLLLLCLRFLVTLTNEVPLARTWLFEQITKWLEPCLIVSNSDQVRESTEALVRALVPEAGTQQLSIGAPSPRIPASASTADAHTDTVRTNLQLIFKHILELMPAARKHAHLAPYDTNSHTTLYNDKLKDDFSSGGFKLVNYFRLLRYCLRTAEDKLLFGRHLSDFFHLYMEIDRNHYDMDENKAELTLFLHQALVECPDNIRFITSDQTYSIQIIEYFVVLRVPTFLPYNQRILPFFYDILYMCCEHDAAFVDTIIPHHNLDWALRTMYIESMDYPQVTEILLKIIRICAPKSESFRHRFIEAISANERLICGNAANLFPFLQMLLITADDFLKFYMCRGLELIQRLFAMAYDGKASDRGIDWDVFWKLSLAVECLRRTTKSLVATANAYQNEAKLTQTRNRAIRGDWQPKSSLAHSMMWFLRYGVTSNVRLGCIDVLESILSATGTGTGQSPPSSSDPMGIILRSIHDDYSKAIVDPNPLISPSPQQPSPSPSPSPSQASPVPPIQLPPEPPSPQPVQLSPHAAIPQPPPSLSRTVSAPTLVPSQPTGITIVPNNEIPTTTPTPTPNPVQPAITRTASVPTFGQSSPSARALPGQAVRVPAAAKPPVPPAAHPANMKAPYLLQEGRKPSLRTLPNGAQLSPKTPSTSSRSSVPIPTLSIASGGVPLPSTLSARPSPTSFPPLPASARMAPGSARVAPGSARFAPVASSSSAAPQPGPSVVAIPMAKVHVMSAGGPLPQVPPVAAMPIPIPASQLTNAITEKPSYVMMPDAQGRPKMYMAHRPIGSESLVLKELPPDVMDAIVRGRPLPLPAPATLPSPSPSRHPSPQFQGAVPRAAVPPIATNAQLSHAAGFHSAGPLLPSIQQLRQGEGNSNAPSPHLSLSNSSSVLGLPRINAGVSPLRPGPLLTQQLPPPPPPPLPSTRAPTDRKAAR
mmetsp:Transcript_12467/g.20271  ORF Transcript_12467/g.20271 Transcript_12467/m.20271 type:complete len:3278 (-) Transcript_12467:248-10081(-)